MKKVYFVTLFISIVFLLNCKLIAQIQNSGFEDWKNSMDKLTREQREALIPGDYIPNESNTGLLPGWSADNLEQVMPASSVEKYIILYPGIYENKIFWGGVRILNNTTGSVILRNCFISGVDPELIGNNYMNETYAFFCDGNNIAQWEIVDCKIDAFAWFDSSFNPPGGARTGNMSYKLRSTSGIRGGSGTVRRCEITNTQDGFSVVQYTLDETDPSYLTIEGSWIHKMIFYKGDGHSQPEGTHSDVIQFHIGRNISIRGNRLGGIYDPYGYSQYPGYNSGDDAKNSVIMLKQEVSSDAIYKLQNIIIEKNIFEGGFFSINHAAARNNSFETTQIKDNWFILKNPADYVIRPKEWADRYSNNKIATWKEEGVSLHYSANEINYTRGASPSY